MAFTLSFKPFFNENQMSYRAVHRSNHKKMKKPTVRNWIHFSVVFCISAFSAFVQAKIGLAFVVIVVIWLFASFFRITRFFIVYTSSTYILVQMWIAKEWGVVAIVGVLVCVFFFCADYKDLKKSIAILQNVSLTEIILGFISSVFSFIGDILKASSPSNGQPMNTGTETGETPEQADERRRIELEQENVAQGRNPDGSDKVPPRNNNFD
jgi:hypothetical protein